MKKFSGISPCIAVETKAIKYAYIKMNGFKFCSSPLDPDKENYPEFQL